MDTELQSTDGEKMSQLPSSIDTGSKSNKLNTKYLDRFLYSTSVSSRLIQMRVFPNVKEITESMAAYAYTSKHIISVCPDSPSTEIVKDAILCIGDGSTPRSAALFALFYPQWECYSIDPQLQEGFIKTSESEIKRRKHDTDIIRKERRELWGTVPNLHIVGECIQRVRIRCRHLVIVMIHCHLSFQQVMSSIDCKDVLGVVSLPCCNYFEIQEQFMGQIPTLECQDIGIWSEKNTVRVWIKPMLDWSLDYSKYVDDVSLLPLVLPSTKRLMSALEMKAIKLDINYEEICACAAGEVITIRRFGKSLLFLFMNTNNVYYTQQRNEYAYYDMDAYNINNECKKPCVIVLKLQCTEKNKDKFPALFQIVSKMKNHTLIYVEGVLELSKLNDTILHIQELQVIANNKRITQAQRYIAGFDVDYLNISHMNERNINYVNKSL